MIENRLKGDLIGLIARGGGGGSVNLHVLCTLGNKLYQVAIPFLPLNVLTQTFIFNLPHLFS